MWQMCLLELGSSWALINRADMKKRKTRHVVFSCCRFHLTLRRSLPTLDGVMRKSVLPHIRHRKSISYTLQWPRRTHDIYFTILICIPSYNPKERRSRKMQILHETPLFLSWSLQNFPLQTTPLCGSAISVFRIGFLKWWNAQYVKLRRTWSGFRVKKSEKKMQRAVRCVLH